jgi:pyruvate formate lyase activating enzyme
MKATPLGEMLARRTVEGELYEKLPNGRVRCFACGHRCLIPPGFDGICRVRFNEDGVLKVPWGYVGALQLDPVEKKPFFHALPGSRALSFGMLGCDYHCGYCFTGDTVVVTDQGPTTFAELFASCARTEQGPDAELAFPEDRRVVAASGRWRPLCGVVRHRYRGELVTIRPFYLPALRCTPDHRIYATTDPARPPVPVRAGDLSVRHYLSVPRRVAAEESQTLDVAALLRDHQITYRVRWDLPVEDRELIAVASARGETSCAIGLAPGKDTSDIPHVRSKIARDLGEVVRRAVPTADNYLVPLRGVDGEPYDGDVYNMEVADEHTYLAGFFAVSNCQNWVTSQALRDPSALAPPQEITPIELVRLAHEHQARIVTSTYNEPLITSEWAVAVFREARAAGLVCSYVSNGNGTPEVLDYIKPWVSLYKVDLKSFRDGHYRELGGTLDRVLWTIRALHERGFWVEIVTLLIPGFNDSDEELRDIARFLVSVSPDIPWHVTAFHKDYKMTGPDNTSVATLLRAAEMGAAEGLRYVYAGNLPGQVGKWENTYCPGCGDLLIERYGFRVLRNRVADGVCPKCARRIPGFWRAPDDLRQSGGVQI